MLDISVLSDFNRKFPDPNYPFLRRQFEEWQKTKPLAGVRIVHNLINSFETLLKIEALAHAGADLTITRCHFAAYPYQNEVDEVLFKAGFYYFPDHRDLSGDFDIGMDCAADLLRLPKVKILKGCVELTRVGAIAYANAKVPYPVISVDDSNLKKLECMLGTGEAFLRAFNALSGETLKNRNVVIFGYGKIGKGIVRYVQPLTNKITIIEASDNAVAAARKAGLNALSISDSDTVKQHLAQAFAIVTATGVDKMLSRHFTASDVGDAYLANMGVDDEIGANFSGNRVLFGKAPINFSLRHPTLMKYFDPICYAHNRAAQMLLEKSYAPGFHAFDAQEDLSIVHEWSSLHNEDVSDIL